MGNEKSCPLCGKTAEFISQLGSAGASCSLACYCRCEFCGLYRYFVGMHGDLGGIVSGNEQGRANCIFECLRIKNENPGKIPYWVTHDGIEKNPNIMDEDGFVVLDIQAAMNVPVDHSQKPFLLLERIAKGANRGRAFGDYQITDEDKYLSRIPSETEMATIIGYLEKSGYIAQDHHRKVKMTVKGWEAIRGRMAFPNTDKAFVAMQFNWEDEPEREGVLKAIRDACKDNGYVADVVTQDHTDNVNDRIISEIKKARFVVAELTYNNRGVYFEAGFARGLGIPVFQVVRHDHVEGEGDRKIHFDIQQVMHRKWTTPDDLRKQLSEWIAATLGPFGASGKHHPDGNP